MTKPDKEEKFKNLKKETTLSGLGAIFIFIFDSFVLGSPMFSVFALIYLLVYIIPVTVIAIKNKPKLRFFGYKLVIYTILVISTFGLHSYDISLAEQSAGVVISAIDQYHQDKGHYPHTLYDLVPAYISEIPRPRIAPGVFRYVGGSEDPHLMYTDMAPFGRVSWSFKNTEWIHID
jgi:hypothetical protein